MRYAKLSLDTRCVPMFTDGDLFLIILSRNQRTREVSV